MAAHTRRGGLLRWRRRPGAGIVSAASFFSGLFGSILAR